MSLYSKCGALAFVFSLIVPSSAAFADEPAKANQPAKAIDKKRDPSKHHSVDQSAQMMFGGAKYFVIGPISKIEDNYFYVKDEELGDDVRLVMDEGTKVICVVPTADGSVRNCALSVGDRVRAEVSDLGTVTTIRALPEQEKPYGKTARQHMGELLSIAGPSGDYVVVPAAFGSVRALEPQGPTPVKGPDGQMLGSVHKLIIDSGSGRIICAVIRKADDDTLVPVPWADLSISQQEGAVVLTNRHLQLEPPDSPKTLLDRSPNMENLNRLVKDLQDSIPPDIRADGQQQMKNQETQRTAQNRNVDCPDPKTVKGDVVKGRVENVQDNFLIIRDASGMLIHVHKDTCTRQMSQRIRSAQFLPGDTVEAYVTPKGNAISLEMVRPASYASIPD